MPHQALGRQPAQHVGDRRGGDAQVRGQPRRRDRRRAAAQFVERLEIVLARTRERGAPAHHRQVPPAPTNQASSAPPTPVPALTSTRKWCPTGTVPPRSTKFCGPADSEASTYHSAKASSFRTGENPSDSDAPVV